MSSRVGCLYRTNGIRYMAVLFKLKLNFTFPHVQLSRKLVILNFELKILAQNRKTVLKIFEITVYRKWTQTTFRNGKETLH